MTPGQGVRFTVTPITNALAGTAQSMLVTVFDAYILYSTGTQTIGSLDVVVGSLKGQTSIKVVANGGGGTGGGSKKP